MTKRSTLATLLLGISTIAACAAAPAGQGDDNGGGDSGGRPSDDGNDDGGGGPGPGGGSGSGEGADVLDAINEAECELALACEQDWDPQYGDFSEYYGTNQASCVQLGEDYYGIGLIAQAIASGTIEVDATAAQACMNAIASIAQTSCGDYFDQGLDLPDACYTFLTGTVPANGACTLSEECANDGFCGEANTCEAE